MRTSRITFFFVALALALLPACGGGGNGYSVQADPLEITSSTIDPTLVSGDVIDWMIPLDGGCSGVGPYVVEVIAGQLPDGVGVDYENGRHHLVGVILEDGPFDFTIKVTDTSCDPFRTGVVEFNWNVGQGPVRIVGCNPPLIPVASFNDPLKYPDADALATVVYGSFVNYDLIVAGGVAPYSCALVDDPTDPDDGALPTGLSFAVNSCSLVGTPGQVGPAGRPFRYTIRVTDDVGNTSEHKFQHKIDTPPIIIPNTELVDGKAGTDYFDSVSAVDGVPPLAYELTDNAPNDDGDTATSGNQNDNLDFTPGQTASIVDFIDGALPFNLSPTGPALDNAKLRGDGLGRIDYPSETAFGPDYSAVPMPPEGLYLQDVGAGSGNLKGVPRRRGDFRVIFHVYSTLVPNERGQHAFKELSFSIEQSEPPSGSNPRPAFDLDPEWTQESTAWNTGSNNVEPFNNLPDMEVGKAYNVQLAGMGGVASDGHTDAPHEDQRVTTPLEPAGTYKWDALWASSGATPPPGVAMTSAGVISVVNPNALVKIGRDLVDLTVIDHQLPNGVGGVENENTRTLAYSIGPDSIIVTVSTDSFTQTDTSWTSSSKFEPNDMEMKVKRSDAFSTGPSDLVDLADADLTHPVPAVAGLGTTGAAAKLLSGATGGDTAGVDFLVGIINPTGWWADVQGMNPVGGRHGAHSDPNMDDMQAGKWNTYYYAGTYAYNSYYSSNWQPNVSCVELPDAEGVAGPVVPGKPDGYDPVNGIYTDGGRMYPFESANRFGIMVVRENGKIYVPFAYQKNTTFTGFGDGTVEAYSTSARDAYMRTVQMTISPDGRIGAMKLKKSYTNLYEQAADSAILLISLTGEGMFGGQTYRIIDTGVAATGTSTPWNSTNRVMYAQSMALTNSHLYFLIGSRSGTSFGTQYWQTFSGHWLMRANVFSGGAGLLPVSGTDSNWTQAANMPMQTTFQHHGYAGNLGSYGYSYLQTSYRGSSSYRLANYVMFAQGGSNFHEHTLAPTPFRVSRNGQAVAFKAAAEPSPYYSDGLYYYSDDEIYKNYLWVDFQAAGARRIASTVRRSPRGSSSGYIMHYGPDYGQNWGRYTGPTPGLEISDDGLRVASVYADWVSSTSVSPSGGWARYTRENVVLASSTDASWGGYGEATITASRFSSGLYWRFGALAFTADDDGLVFWGGGPAYYPTSTSYNYSDRCWGSFYVYKTSSPTAGTVYNMLSTASGGWSTTAGSTVSSFSPTTTTSSSTSYFNRFGAVQPRGGFISRNRNFMYIVAYGSLTSSRYTACELLGLNISSIASGSINGHPNCQGFLLSGVEQRRGFMDTPAYSSSIVTRESMGYPVGDTYSPHGHQGQGRQVMAKDSGYVFWAAKYQAYSYIRRYYSTSPMPYYTPGSYGYYPGNGGVHTYGFNADVGGPVKKLSTVNTSTSTYSSTSTDTYRERMVWMDTPRDGSKLILTTQVSNQTSLYYYNGAAKRTWHKEKLIQVSDINFNPTTGVMHSGFSAGTDSTRLESVNGRSGEAMVFVGDDLFYSFKAGAGNDTQMQLTKASYDPTTGAWTKDPLVGAPSGQPIVGRIHVLGGGR